ncbi:GNAT family N-acetyltransferase [Chryseobacterium sp. BIGb0232]|uniref:GNAT family N-acetyltransferase n=1 Tax=Chryseobacterium sp. BIGb0232 TaxID=2940598 RepID=UPI000F469AF3|nr:GNAT family N-acetyltransferase [Chryseobacterium sp. BIGb0232]MCS4301727.1 putative acetyltransferase [Chryseobacterium sp. BIGb0232]ROS19419.1 putative acetyltransferase [Chryseobacterium nakagawai]
MNNNTSDNPKIILREGNQYDLPEMLQLFKDTITTVCNKDYNTDQLEAWKSGADNQERWEKVISKQYILIAESENKMAGFCTLDQGNYIDLLFIHKDYQHQGIASKLYRLIEKEALQQNQKFLTADVSKTAKPFFERMNFKIIQEQIVSVKGVDLVNYKMEKSL